MSGPSDIVTSQFAASHSYATTFIDQLTEFTTELQAAVYTAPGIDVTFAPVVQPTPLSLPTKPAVLSELDAEMRWDLDGGVASSKPEALSIDLPDVQVTLFDDTPPDVDALYPDPITIDYGTAPDVTLDQAPTLDFGTALTLDVPDAPTLDAGTAPTISIGSAPTLSFANMPSVTWGDRPTIGAVASVDLPNPIEFVLPDAPTYLTLTTPTFDGLDLHASYLTALSGMPLDLTLTAPTPFEYTPGAAYSSSLLDSLKSILATRLAGGTGLDPTVEQAIWDRARARESALSAANEADILRTSDGLGFQLPAGVIVDQVRQAQVEGYNKASGLSRDVMIKQAELEQENMKQTISMVLDLEGRLIENAFKLEQITFESAKAVAENSITIHNALLDEFKTLTERFQVYAGVYKSVLEGELAKVEVYKAELQAEQTKATVNVQLVEEYKAKISGSMALVDIYKAQLGAAEALIQIEGTKLNIKGEEIKAYIADINGATASLEAWKVGVQAELVQYDIYGAEVKGQVAKAEVFKATAEVESAKGQVFDGQVRVQMARASARQAEISTEAARGALYQEVVKGQDVQVANFAAKVGAYKAQVEGAALTTQQVLGRLEGYKTKAAAFAQKSSVEGEKARVELSRYNAMLQAKQNEWSAWVSRVGAERDRFTAVAGRSSIVLDGYKADVQKVLGQVEQDTKRWDVQVHEYQGTQAHVLAGQKLNADILMAAKQLNSDIAKTGTQVFAQLTASALHQVTTTAGIQGNSATNVSYNYGGQTNADVTPVTIA